MVSIFSLLSSLILSSLASQVLAVPPLPQSAVSPGDAYLMYRSCITKTLVFGRSSSAIPACLVKVDEAFPLGQVNEPNAPVITTLNNVKIQTLYDVIAGRFPKLNSSAKTTLIRYLLGNANAWEVDQRQAALFHSIRLSRADSRISQFVWNQLCGSNFIQYNPAAAPLATREECLQAASLLGTSRFSPADVLKMLKIVAQEGEYFGASNRYQEIQQYVMSFIANRTVSPQILDVTDINISGAAGKNFLMISIEENNFGIASALIRKGADVNLRSHDGTTALMIAVKVRNLNMVRLLMQNGADTNIQNDLQGSALMYAARSGNIEITRLLLVKGADPNLRVVYGRTPLMFTYNMDMAGLLLASGADPMIQDQDGNNALADAVSHGKIQVVLLLLENGVDYRVRNRDGKTALDLAIEARNMGMIQILQQFVFR